MDPATTLYFGRFLILSGGHYTSLSRPLDDKNVDSILDLSIRHDNISLTYASGNGNSPKIPVISAPTNAANCALVTSVISI